MHSGGYMKIINSAMQYVMRGYKKPALDEVIQWDQIEGFLMSGHDYENINQIVFLMLEGMEYH